MPARERKSRCNMSHSPFLNDMMGAQGRMYGEICLAAPHAKAQMGDSRLTQRNGISVASARARRIQVQGVVISGRWENDSFVNVGLTLESLSFRSF